MDEYDSYKPLQAGCPVGTRPYTILAGDTYYRLAQRFGTTVGAITAANPGVDPARLRVGQVICIPTGPIPRPCPRAFEGYTVKAGDTLYSIARSRGTTVQVLLAYNPGINPNNLRIGEILCVPPIGAPPPVLPPRCPTGLISYTIRPGDTLSAIARAHQTTVEIILHYNPTIDPNNLQVGQVICV